MSNNTQIFRISSDKYTSKAGETLTINIPADILNRPAKSIKVIDAVIPYTFTNIPSNGNSFNFTDNVGTNLVTIPGQTLSPKGLISALKDLLDGNSGAGLTFTTVYNQCMGRIQIKADGPYTLNFNVPNSAATLLGFDPASYVAVESPPASNVWVVNSVRRDQLSLDKYINITSNLVKGIDQGVIILNGQPVPTVSNIIATIPVDGAVGNNIVFTESQDAPSLDIRASVLGQIVEPNKDVIRTVEFGLSLDSGIPANLNGSFWSARFLITFI